MNEQVKNRKIGFLCLIAAQVIWGCFPIYVDLLKIEDVKPIDFVGHRIIWSFLLLAGFFAYQRWVMKIGPATNSLATRIVAMSAVSAFLIATNWICFVWAVTNSFKIDASLGYYICPQIVVLFGVVLLGERLTRLQWIGVALATAGVTYMTVTKSGQIWVSLLIAISFGLYALSKKQTKLSALVGLSFETGILFIPAVAFAIWRMNDGVSFFKENLMVNCLLVGSGIATVTPLALYAKSLKHIPLSTVGLLQFLGPTIQFLIGVLLYGEEFKVDRLVGFAFVWVGIALYLLSLKGPGKSKSNSGADEAR